jgi:hypothetical protein
MMISFVENGGQGIQNCRLSKPGRAVILNGREMLGTVQE